MAISKSFFGLRRGSTKSLTFSIYQGKQVTKDRVAFVKNPNTIAQRLQRMKFLGVQLVLNAGLGGIIDHSWENKKYGSESRQYFSSKALKLSGPFIGKDQEQCVPMPVQVSEGSLDPVPVTYENGAVYVNALDARVQAGEQITIIAVFDGKVIVERAICKAIIMEGENKGYTWDKSDGIESVAEQGFAEGKIFVATYNEQTVPCGFVAIRSKYTNGKWNRSTETIQINTAAEDAYYTADAMNVAVQSWDTKANENMLSNWYLNLSDTVYDGADVVISVKTQSGGNTKVRARMVNVQGELIPYIYTTTGTSAGYCITASGARSSVLGSAIQGAIGFVQWGTLGNSTGNNNGAQGGSSDPVMP